jgi:hypothetical protein
VLVTTCFLAVYVTKEMFGKAPNLKPIVTAEGVQIRAFYNKRLTGSRVRRHASGKEPSSSGRASGR